MLVMLGRTASGVETPTSGINNSGDTEAFRLRAEWAGPCTFAPDTIDVNLGNSPISFVRAAYCQVSGHEPPWSLLAWWAHLLVASPNDVRRVDVVRAFCADAQRSTCRLRYSNPWLNQVIHADSCMRKTQRDLGAVFMFFFHCPGGENCTMDWANSHAIGMDTPDPLYSFRESTSGYYTPENPGFWYRELLDARYSGLQFLLPNVYGPDIRPETGAIKALDAALDLVGGGIQVGLFTDTWAWGQPYWGKFMQPIPDLNNLLDAAQRIYQAEWKPFFGGISNRHWYRVNGRPLIYFYNAGTLARSKVPDLIDRMKVLFEADFGIVPFVVLDRGYQAPHPVDGQFTWYTLDLDGHISRDTTETGIHLTNFMVKWDSTGRSHPGQIYSPWLEPGRPNYKGPEILKQVLKDTEEAQVAVLATWNDLGEGTGVGRNYDYYYQGRWLEPDYFMKTIRRAQCY
jgi:hypothetical protein